MSRTRGRPLLPFPLSPGSAHPAILPPSILHWVSDSRRNRDLRLLRRRQNNLARSGLLEECECPRRALVVEFGEDVVEKENRFPAADPLRRLGLEKPESQGSGALLASRTVRAEIPRSCRLLARDLHLVPVRPDHRGPLPALPLPGGAKRRAEGVGRGLHVRCLRATGHARPVPDPGHPASGHLIVAAAEEIGMVGYPPRPRGDDPGAGADQDLVPSEGRIPASPAEDSVSLCQRAPELLQRAGDIRVRSARERCRGSAGAPRGRRARVPGPKG